MAEGIEGQTPQAPGPNGKKAGIAAAIALILGSVYAVEGGYVNDRSDPGGATIYGITEKVARADGYTGDMRLFPKHCDGPAAACADNIYVHQYIEQPGFMPVIEADPAVGAELVDTGVNMGPARPSKWFEQSLNELGAGPVPVTGKIDAGDVAAYRKLQATSGAVEACVLMLTNLDSKQLTEYRRLVRVNPKLGKFYNGWVRARIGNIDRKTCGQGA
jgi:lysozyme family protein